MKTIYKSVSIWAAMCVVFALCASLLTPSIASAQGGSGVGTLTASGKGVAWFHGNGTITVSGNGVLRIRDYAKDAQINVQATNGAKRVFVNGWIRYAGFQGTATVTGSNVYVELGGGSVNLTANGSGRYVLRGNGTYSTTTETGTWTTMTKTLNTPP